MKLEEYILEDIGSSSRTKSIKYAIRGDCWEQTTYPIKEKKTTYVTRLGKNMPLHRYVAMIYLGEPVDLGEYRYHVIRSCGNNNCINPNHLYWRKGNKKKEFPRVFIRSVFSDGRLVQEYRKSHGENYIRVREFYGVVEHKCSKCFEWKHIGLFSERRGSRTHICKLCRRSYEKFYYKRNHEEFAERNKLNYEKNKERILEINRKYRENHKMELIRYREEWHLKNSGRKQQAVRKREMMNALLGNCLSTEEYESHIEEFYDGKCALTGMEEVHLEHFIPSSIGHGGTSLANCYPLEPSLNYSKNRNNPFEWIKRKMIREQVDMDKWNKLVSNLASLNNLTVEEYKDYVYWCFDNPRTIEDLKQDNTPSLKLWRHKKESSLLMSFNLDG